MWFLATLCGFRGHEKVKTPFSGFPPKGCFDISFFLIVRAARAWTSDMSEVAARARTGTCSRFDCAPGKSKIGYLELRIKQAVSVANFRANHEGGHDQEQVERFRASLISLPRHEQVNSYLGLFGSHERALPLWEATLCEPATVFWRVFLRNWCVCVELCSRRKLLAVEAVKSLIH